MSSLNKAEAIKREGNELYRLGQYESASNKYKEAIELDNQNYIIYSNQALCYMKREMYAFAYVACLKCLSLYPAEKAACTLVSACAAMGDYREALDTLKRAKLPLTDSLKEFILKSQHKHDERVAKNPAQYQHAAFGGLIYQPPSFVRELKKVNLNTLVSSSKYVGAIGIVCNDTQGYGLVADNDMQKGEPVVWEEKPFLVCTVLDNACNHCGIFHSTKQEIQLLNCANCTTQYCSDSCMAEANEMYHPGMCGADVKSVLPFLRSGKTASSRRLLLILKIWGYCETLRIKGNTEDYWKFWEKPGFAHLCPSNNPAVRCFGPDLECYKQFYTATNTFYHPHYDFLWYLRAQSTILLNTFTVFNEESCKLYPDAGAGVALHKLAALLNHSCTPNMIWNVDERGVFSAVGDTSIKKGQQLYIQYIDSVPAPTMGVGSVSIPAKTRLKMTYGFTCECAKCQDVVEHVSTIKLN